MLLVHYCLKICLVHGPSLKQGRHTFGGKDWRIIAAVIVFSDNVAAMGHRVSETNSSFHVK